MQIELSSAEALILFERLFRILHDKGSAEFQNQAEELTAASVLCQLESSLTEPLSENYTELLRKAEKEIAENYGV